jgi:hypothetical protein
MSDWGIVEGQLGANQMWNINKALLDKKMAQGKTFFCLLEIQPPPVLGILRSWDFLI